LASTDLEDSKRKIEDLIKENKNFTTNNKNINDKLNEAEAKRINLEKAVRVTKEEASDLKNEIDKLIDEITRLTDASKTNKDESLSLKQKLQQTEDERYNLSKKKEMI